MKRAGLLLLGLCLLVPATADAAAAAIDCKSAKPPTTDWATYLSTCRSQAAAARKRILGDSAPAAAAVLDVYDSRTTVAGANWANVPTWSEADIVAQFRATRDAQYMTTAGDPRLRRISWQYPDDGCFTRAEQVNVRVAQAGKPKPYKLFAFGRFQRLYVSTPNDVDGVVDWWYHVVPVVKNPAGQAIVLDAAVSPCRPLFWREWLALMANDLSFFDDVAGGNGVTVADPNAYIPFSLVTGEPSHAQESLDDQVGIYLFEEWNRAQELGRDPNAVLFATPPWSGYGCWGSKLVTATANVGPGANTTVTATCPIGTLAVGGGFGAGTNSFAISKSAMSGRSWQVTGRNNGSTTKPLWSEAACLIGAPSGASISSIQGNVVNVAANSNGTSTATCGSGKLTSGGFTTTLGTNPATVMRIYNNNRTTSTGNTWQASAQNTTAASKSVTSFAYCLQGTNYNVTQISANLTSNGSAIVACNSSTQVSAGGGITFPRLTNYTVTAASFLGPTAYYAQMSPAPAAGDANAKAFAECLSHP